MKLLHADLERSFCRIGESIFGHTKNKLDVPHGYPADRMVTIEEDVRVIKVGNSLRFAIPVVFCKALEIEQGHTLRLTSTNGNILVSPQQHKVSTKKP